MKRKYTTPNMVTLDIEEDIIAASALKYIDNSSATYDETTNTLDMEVKNRIVDIHSDDSEDEW